MRLANLSFPTAATILGLVLTLASTVRLGALYAAHISLPALIPATLIYATQFAVALTFPLLISRRGQLAATGISVLATASLLFVIA